MKNISKSAFVFPTAILCVIILSQACKKLPNPAAPQPTAAITLSPANTATNMPTGTATYTRTRTSTPTVTRTSTNGPTSTFTATRTITRTFTAAATITASPIFTQTASNTATPTVTQTDTPYAGSPTDTLTHTVSPTLTQTFTTTPTFTVTSTGTFTFTRTATRTISPTFTVSPTGTDTPVIITTPTSTATVTATACAAGAWSASYGTTAGIFKFRLVNCNTAIEFQLDADTVGWIALAWLNTGSTIHQSGANVVMTWYAAGTANAQDQYMVPGGGRAHTVDTTACTGGANNILSVTGSETAAPAHTTINFVYPLGATDGTACDTALVRGNTYTFATAFRADDTITSAHGGGVHTVTTGVTLP